MLKSNSVAFINVLFLPSLQTTWVTFLASLPLTFPPYSRALFLKYSSCGLPSC
jgi:hypothetical protein